MRRLALLLALSIGCKGGEASAPQAPAPAPAARPPEATPSAPPASRAVDPAVRALLAEWERAQDQGDFEGYAALYGARFTGVRRSGPRTRSFDRAGWLADRGRMFGKTMQVDFALTSSSPAGPSVVVLGEQHFKSGSYEDRGPKRLVLTREAGALRIAREEMLASDLSPPPGVAARFVVQPSDGPPFVLLARAPAEPSGAPRGVYPGSTSVLSFDAASSALPGEARLFGDASTVQVVGADGVCSARVVGVRRALVLLPHFGTVAAWRGDDPNQPTKPGADEVRKELEELGPASFWALELDASCPGVGTRLAVASGAKVAVATRDEPVGAEAAALTKAFASLPALRKLSADERNGALASLTMVRHRLGAVALATVATASDCSAPMFHATYALAPTPRLEDGGEGGLESVEFVADLDGDGAPELVGTGAIGGGELFVTDRAGRPLLTASLPLLDCPC